MIDITTNYLGLKLKSPIVASSSPLCKTIDDIKRLEDGGVGAICLHSLFEEQIEMESIGLNERLSGHEFTYGEALSYFPDLTTYNIGADGYLEHIRKAKQATKVPIIGNLNGISFGGWVRFAKEIEEAGADALELNLYNLPVDTETTGAEVEAQYEELVEAICEDIRIPVSVKVGPFFSAIPNMAKRFEKKGAKGLVIFNRFYQPDLDLDNLDVKSRIVLSDSNELLMRLHWTALLYGNVNLDVAITGGVHSGIDVIKCMMVGARAAMSTSALLRHGPDYAKVMESQMVEWMEEHEYESVGQMQGSMSGKHIRDKAAFERANYMKVLGSYQVAR